MPPMIVPFPYMANHAAASKSPPKLKVGEDPWLEQSRYRKFWRKEEIRKAKAMRTAGICLVRVMTYNLQ